MGVIFLNKMATKMKKKGTHVIDENIALDKDKQTEFAEKIKEIDADDKPGTIYVGHIPHGFYENQIRDYFTQFGTVNKVRLARSKKTGGYKGYGYVQFAEEEVAKIAAS